jgi:uncharacterized membrane protein
VTRYIKAYLTSLAALLALDAVWLGLVAREFYSDRLAHLMASNPSWPPAAVFYPLYVVGVLAFVVSPAAKAGSLRTASWRGALFGLVAYATYNLTNQATLRDWPPVVTVVDMAWGCFVTTAAGLAGYAASRPLSSAR